MDGPAAELFLALGALLLLGLAADFLGRRTALPRVTLLLCFGVLMGEQLLGLIPSALTVRFDLITDLALLMIGFLLGGKLTLGAFRELGRQLGIISVAASVGTALVVSGLLRLAGADADVAILLGCIAAATDAAATVDTVLESGSSSRFSHLLLGIVAVDDAWALIIFSLGLALVAIGNGAEGSGPIYAAVWELLGGLGLGALLGLPAAFLTGRIRPGQPMLMEALGLILVCGALAWQLEVSLLLAAMAMGTVVANLAAHHDYAFHEIENVEWPFMVVFFVLAGATLDLHALAGLGLLGAVYVLARALAKVLGASAGATLAGADPEIRHWLGLALLPQAGVAIGMALIASNEYPEIRDIVLPIVIGSTVLFELLGPVATRLSLQHTTKGG